jgi:hypothetical protein
MSKSFFDDVYENKLLFDKEALYRNKDKTVNNIIREKAKEQLVYTDGDLENLLAKARNNPTKPFTKDEADLISKRLNETKDEAKKILNQVKELKDFHNEKASKAEDKYTLDISKNSNLKRSANRIFGGNKKTITYEDYATLMEMKKQIQLNEALDLLMGEDSPDGLLQKIK